MKPLFSSKAQLTLVFVICAAFFISFATNGNGGNSALADQAVGLIKPKKEGGKKPKIVDTDSGDARVFVYDPDKDDKVKIDIADNAVITLNGEPANVTDLKADDVVDYTQDLSGRIVTLSATRAINGIVLSVRPDKLVITSDYVDRKTLDILPTTKLTLESKDVNIDQIHPGDHVSIVSSKANGAIAVKVSAANMLLDFWHNFQKNLFKPLLLFFYLGFCITLLKVPFEFPHAIYQGLTVYLLLAIGWHGGEELAILSGAALSQAAMYMLVGFCTNLIIGFCAYFILRSFIPKMRKIDAATVAAYYGSDSAGTFVTALGVLQVAAIKYAAYMPVMLAIMEIPGCLVGLYLASRMRRRGMDKAGNMPDEPNYNKQRSTSSGVHILQSGVYRAPSQSQSSQSHSAQNQQRSASQEMSGDARAAMRKQSQSIICAPGTESSGIQVVAAKRSQSQSLLGPPPTADDVEAASKPASQARNAAGSPTAGPPVPVVDTAPKQGLMISPMIIREIFLNPGIFLLLGGILIGFLSRLQGSNITAPDDQLFVSLFQGMLCLFLLEMGMTASRRLKDLKTAGPRFIVFGLVMPNIFALFGIGMTSVFSHVIGQPLQLGTYLLFAVLCAAASYIAVPAIQRLAIPEASPTLPLAASLGLTFTYNVTVGIPLYLAIAETVIKNFPVVGA